MFISVCHDLPHVDYYECSDSEFGIKQILLQYQSWFQNANNFEQLKLYIKQRTITILADRPFCLAVLNSNSAFHTV